MVVMVRVRITSYKGDSKEEEGHTLVIVPESTAQSYEIQKGRGGYYTCVLPKLDLFVSIGYCERGSTRLARNVLRFLGPNPNRYFMKGGATRE